MEKKEEGSLDCIADIPGVSSNIGVMSLVYYSHSMNIDFFGPLKEI